MRNTHDSFKEKIVVFFSYDDPYRDMGGTSKTILGQIGVFNAANIDCVIISPFHLGGRIWKKTFWTVRINKDIYSVFSTSCLKNFLGKLDKKYKIGGFVIHHLKNIDIKQLCIILDSLDKPIYFYIHDFFTVKPYANVSTESYLLDNISYANKTFKTFFLKYRHRSVFISPSEYCRDKWCEYYPEFKEKAIVISHQKNVGLYTNNLNLIGEESILSIAFVGAQLEIKGWCEYKAICEHFKDDHRFKFYYLGSGTEMINGVVNEKVSIQNPKFTMVDALRKNGIDVVCLLSKVPETYSYTFFEAMSSNALIIAFANSGNIARQVNKWKNGCIVSDYGELESLLQNFKKMQDCVNSFRQGNKGGPLQLVDNDEFVNMIRFEKKHMENNSNKWNPNLLGVCLCAMYKLKGYVKKQK